MLLSHSCGLAVQSACKPRAKDTQKFVREGESKKTLKVQETFKRYCVQLWAQQDISMGQYCVQLWAQQDISMVQYCVQLWTQQNISMG